MVAVNVVPTWLADWLVLPGLPKLLVAAYGMVRLPALYKRIHAVSVAGFSVIVPFLIGAFLLLTTMVGTHAISHAAYPRGERQEPPDDP